MKSPSAATTATILIPGRGKTLSSWHSQREVPRKSRLSELPYDLFLPRCIYSILFTLRRITEMALRKIIYKNTIFYCISKALKLFRNYRCHPVLPPKNATWLHRSESELLKMHALLN
jgi:hypothetical protein